MRIPHNELPSRIAEVLDAAGGDRALPIVVYCRSGNRSGMAKKHLVDAGFSQVTNLGGYSDWPGD
jgi:phage shock protein E